MPLTDAAIRALKPQERPYKAADFEGLYLLVKPTGSKLWHFKYRIDGKERTLSAGIYPEVSLAQARAKKDEARGLLAAGKDPSEAKKERKLQDQARRGNTFEAIAQDFIKKAAAEGRAPATQTKTEWLLGMAIASFGKKPISDVTVPVVLACLRKVEAKGNYETAKRLRAKIGAVFRFAVAKGLVATDPTYALQGALVRHKATPRAAITDPQALGGLLRAIDGYQGETTTRLSLSLLAILVQRPGELRHAKWAEFDMEEKVWSIPASRMKMRRDHRVPLPDQAINVLKELHDLTGSGEYLLPSLRSVSRPMSENTMNGALRRLGFSGDEVTAHGFRASFSTLANESGLWHPDAIERALAHVEGNAVRRAYARGEHWEERVKMADWWERFLEALKRPSSAPGGGPLQPQ
jgi:integrase